jgi:antitoxin component YwqK of YwqJK toxin-antitoxin module
MKALAILYFLTASAFVKAQELKRVTKSNMHFGEIYYVLKNNRDIKQGQYLKYFESMNMYDKAIESYGTYENNKRIGAWIFCDAEDIYNPLTSIGEYKDDKKIGVWTFFYEPISDDKNFFNFSSEKKHTRVILPTKENEQFKITLDTTGIRTAATGEYLNNKKSGIWSFYFINGSLACKYDFSTNTMTQNNGLKSYNQLGGIERFIVLFHKSLFEKKINSQPFYVQSSNVVFELTTYHDSIDIKKLDSNGSIPFANAMENILSKMPLDWINFDPRLEENKIKIYINYVVNDRIGTVKLDSIKPLN